MVTEELKTFNHLLVHASMLADRERVGRYRKAIREVVEKGSRVADLGTGTGLLASFACQCGAARVHAVERLPVIEVARDLFRRQGWADRVTTYERTFTGLKLPDKVDVIVHELLGSFGVGETSFADIVEFRDNNLADGGTMIPAQVDMVVVPVTDPEFYKMISFADRDDDLLDGLDLAGARELSLNDTYGHYIRPEHYLGTPQTVATVDFHTITVTEAAQFDHEVALTVAKEGELHGIGGWFTAQLSPSVTLTNLHSDESNSWYNQYFPIIRPVAVKPGDKVNLHLQMHGVSVSHFVWIWNIQVRREVEGEWQEIANYHQNTFRGQLFSKKLVEVADENYCPQVSDNGRLAQFVLAHCDGNHSGEAIVEKWLSHNEIPEDRREWETLRVQRMVERAWLLGDIT